MSIESTDTVSEETNDKDIAEKANAIREAVEEQSKANTATTNNGSGFATPICGVTGKELKFEDKLQPSLQRYSKSKRTASTMWLHLDKNEPTVAKLLEERWENEKALLALHNQSPTSLYSN